MNNLEKIIELDYKYLETFSNRKDTAWGAFFYNVNQPDYYDANHAHIHKPCSNPQAVIQEALAFYQELSIIPRFYLYDLVNQQELISELKKQNFGYEELISPVQLWNNQMQNKKIRESVTIEEVNDHNYEEAINIEGSIKELGGEVRAKAFAEEYKHEEYTHYLLRYNGAACSTACIFEHDHQARMENVATLEEYRGRGLIGELITYIQQEVSKRGLSHLWVFPITEAVEKVYCKSGFETIAKLKTGHAFLGGKSIQEIREGE
ncbi:N-acetylglutamate synthase-like GNAT family acetyltransferase [Peribacillus deserti]|uniref:N-acetylglutamate synthase-like GNAT family acetyltransferase n=1 Tax=Peribacillus deserti TaxID=673318 RepID=A0ABS2QN24_9BACI|nr:GNAT family N-acetyltransferase [Peribacillus deserti]MBM7693878.1 N-acetylglutamate synthase-like GNAT family acetyltransferase [Peribacillus deserti]